MDPQSQTNNIRRRVIVGAVILFPLLVLWWLFGHSYITVTVPQPSGTGKITYRLVNQSSHKAITITDTSTKLTKLVPRGSYEVTVTQSETSSFNVTKTSGFLRKSTVASKLVTQPARQFVGNNPQGCMYYLQNTLYSYDCVGATTRTTHVPANATTPTYNLKNIDGMFGSVEGIVNTKAGLVALFQSNSAPHIAYILTGTVKSSQGVRLRGLDSTKVYKLAAYKEGFIAYDSSFTDIHYYQSIRSAPQTISIQKPTDQTQKPLFLSTSSDSIVVTYSDKAGFEEASDPKAIGKVKDEIFVYANGQTKDLSFNKQYSVVMPCGTDKLCLTEAVSKRLSIYDVSAKPKLLYAVEGVNTSQIAGQNLLAVRNDDILSLDINNESGSVAYAFGSYHSCGLQNDGDNYLLCLTDSKAKNVVLRMVPATADTDNIDKKVAQLQETLEITSVSAYGSYIFISPNVGSLVYNQASNSYVYNPTVVRSVNSKIDAKIKSLSIDRSKYTIVNTVQ